MLVDGAGELWAMDEGSRNGVWRGRERVTYARVEDVGVLGVGGFVVVAEHETNAGTALRAGLIARAWRDAARPPPPSAVNAMSTNGSAASDQQTARTMNSSEPMKISRPTPIRVASVMASS